MREIKFRAYVKFLQETHNVVELRDNGDVMTDGYSRCLDKDDINLMQFTGFTDIHGVEIYKDDLINVFYTSDDGQHYHDCVYRVMFGVLGDVKLRFVKLMWVGHGYNQYPLSMSLEVRHETLDYMYSHELQRYKLQAPNGSNYFKIIGNAHTNPELLEKNNEK